LLFYFLLESSFVKALIPEWGTRYVLHTPVLLEETLKLLAPVDGEIYVDGTLGLGGHTREILEQCGPTGQVIGFDRDGDAIARAQRNLAPYGRRVTFIRRNFAEIKQGLSELDIAHVDGLLLDIGLSSLQLDASGRGFSFKGNELLDMRMDDRGRITAADLLNRRSADELADIFYYYGEERHARRIAARIVSEREKVGFETTDQLAAVVAQAIPKRFHPKKIHVATKVFQALRIAVNRELESLARILTPWKIVWSSGSSGKTRPLRC
jgi:16S rRNA (cytosine1402-N4)-methyltransferase